MLQHEEIPQFPATELRRLILQKQLSPVELTEACLAQIERVNPKINAMVTLSEQALDEAREAEKKLQRGEEAGLLCGLPVGIKDVTPVAGLRTTYGSPLYAEHVPEEDALVVRRLRQAGAVILGKTNCPEFAAGGNTFNEVFGATRNPWNLDLSAGGSTGGGAAALATGMIALAEGSDLGGSLRIPAAFCGVVGLRPSPGLVPTYPADYLWDTLSVTGPMGRTAADVALLLQVMSGGGGEVPLSQRATGRDFITAVEAPLPKGLRIAYCADVAGIGIDAEIEAICRSAAQSMAQAGALVEEGELDLAFARDAFLALRGYWMAAQHYQRLDKLDALGANVAGNIRAGLKLTVQELAAAEQTRTRLWETMRVFFQKYDALLTPCLPIPPFPVEQNYPETIAGKKMQNYVDWFASTFVFSLTSLPVGCVPCGLTAARLPVGLQVAGPPLDEERVLSLMRQVQDMHAIGLPPIVIQKESCR